MIFILELRAGKYEVTADYDSSSGKIVNTVPSYIADQTVTNHSEATQSPSVNLTKSVTVTESFSQTSGFSITVGATFKVGVPLVAEGEVKTEMTVKHEFTMGQTSSISTTVGQVVPVTTPPHSSIKATATMKSSTIDVPCTITFKHKETGASIQSKVVYHGLSYWDFTVTYKNV
ncbi:hypothetical protein N7520_000210 [Penicillium odoratum]|uniref:uncharacterized protein n=1 Tax=Penicillium odoratum TaxID=1167516 RepID=UPI00254950D5|nr:uncharacterized protein N7520_000210 [Penicillium odoratum]KAJ5776964.1 hypothetical protein N7520_000210 [Penicillium odoratum]